MGCLWAAVLFFGAILAGVFLFSGSVWAWVVIGLAVLSAVLLIFQDALEKVLHIDLDGIIHAVILALAFAFFIGFVMYLGHMWS